MDDSQLVTDEAAALAIVAAIRRACVRADGHDPLDEAAHLRLKHRGLRGVAFWALAGGFALVRDGELDLAVDPERRGQGLGGRLAALAEASTDATLKAWSHGAHPAAARLAQAHGWERVRELWVMRRRSAVPLPDAAPPPGVTVRPFREADVPAVLAVNAAAFASHPEQGALDEQGMAERMAEPWFDPEGLLLAEDEGGELLGFHWTKRHDEQTGEVYVIGISPAAQGRGLGKVLTVAGLRHLAERGVAEVLLYVEADNAPALALYRGLGFGHASTDTHVQYLRRGPA